MLFAILAWSTLCATVFALLWCLYEFTVWSRLVAAVSECNYTKVLAIMSRNKARVMTTMPRDIAVELVQGLMDGSLPFHKGIVTQLLDEFTFVNVLSSRGKQLTSLDTPFARWLLSCPKATSKMLFPISCLQSAHEHLGPSYFFALRNIIRKDDVQALSGLTICMRLQVYYSGMVDFTEFFHSCVALHAPCVLDVALRQWHSHYGDAQLVPAIRLAVSLHDAGSAATLMRFVRGDGSAGMEVFRDALCFLLTQQSGDVSPSRDTSICSTLRYVRSRPALWPALQEALSTTAASSSMSVWAADWLCVREGPHYETWLQWCSRDWLDSFYPTAFNGDGVFESALIVPPVFTAALKNACASVAFAQYLLVQAARQRKWAVVLDVLDLHKGAWDALELKVAMGFLVIDSDLESDASDLDADASDSDSDASDLHSGSARWQRATDAVSDIANVRVEEDDAGDEATVAGGEDVDQTVTRRVRQAILEVAKGRGMDVYNEVSQAALVFAASQGDLRFAKVLIDDMAVDPACLNNVAFLLAEHECAKLLWTFPSVRKQLCSVFQNEPCVLSTAEAACSDGPE